MKNLVSTTTTRASNERGGENGLDDVHLFVEE